jgi:hypothetical protein
MKIVILICLDLAWNDLLGLLHFRWFLNFIRIADDEYYDLQLLDGHEVTLVGLMYLDYLLHVILLYTGFFHISVIKDV